MAKDPKIKKTVIRKTWSKICKSTWISLILTVTAAYMVAMITNVITNLIGKFNGKPFNWSEILDVTQGASLIALLLTTMLGLFYKFQRSFETRWSVLTNSAQLFIHLKDLVKPLDHEAIEIAQHIFLNGQGPKEEIYAIDWNPADVWLTEDMLGYLAIQSQWLQLGQNRKVHRIFVWDNMSRIGEKMLSIHCLMGFDTYIVRATKIESLGIQQEYLRDVLYWDPESENPAKVKVIAAHIKGQAFGYEAVSSIYERKVPVKSSKSKKATEYMLGIDKEKTQKYNELFNMLIKPKVVEIHIPGDYFRESGRTMENLSKELEILYEDS